MRIALLSHVNADGDLLDAWFRHYLRIGVTHFRLVVHGPRSANARLYEICHHYPVTMEDIYEGEFDVREKKRRLDAMLTREVGSWLVLVDSDEFLELPYASLGMTIRALRVAGANALYAPMLQHLSIDGSLNSPVLMDDPFLAQPMCSPDLYRLMGSKASINKFPLFFCASGTRLVDGGNHSPPHGCNRLAASLRGVLHHFKFRQSTLDRLSRRIDSSHPFRDESIVFRRYLEQHGMQVPIEGVFRYSRRALFERDLLRRPGLGSACRWAARRIAGRNSS